MNADLETLQSLLGHEFRDRELLLRALTHRSRNYEQNNAQPRGDNEPMEFLGDAILGFLVCEFLYTRFPDYAEGQLSLQKNYLVSGAHLVTVAEAMELGRFLLLGKGEESSGGRSKRALLSDAVEALIAALYLDGGMDAARAFVAERVLAGAAERAQADPSSDNFKGQLVDMANLLSLPQPRYTTVEQAGPEHAKVFVVEVRMGPEWVSQAQGPSKKNAGQKAAEMLLGKLSVKGHVCQAQPRGPSR